MSDLCPRSSNSKKRSHQKLAFDFCKLDESDLNDDLLQIKRKKTRPIERARITMGETSSTHPPQGAQDGVIEENQKERLGNGDSQKG